VKKGDKWIVCESQKFEKLTKNFVYWNKK